MRIAPIAVAAVALSIGLQGQSPAPRVASVRPVENGRPVFPGPPVNGAFRTRGTSVRWLLHYAYGRALLDGYPLPEGGPSWVDNDLYEINAAGPADLTLGEARRMVLTLLRERFHLKDRVEKRELPVYVLVKARKDGALSPGLQPSTTDCGVYSETLLRTGRLATVQDMGTPCVQTWAWDDRGNGDFADPPPFHYSSVGSRAARTWTGRFWIEQA